MDDDESKRPFDPVRLGFRLAALTVAIVVTVLVCAPYILAKLYNQQQEQAQASETVPDAQPAFIQAFVVTPENGEESAPDSNNSQGTSPAP